MIDNKKNLTDNDCLMYRPFQSENERNINIKRDHYSTSLDPRGYIPVYEYIINNTPIMWDRETGYVHFTGIWKALGNSKSDIVKMVDSNPELGTKKIRGGFLRIQGTWIPYDFAHLLCKRTAWNIRKELIPIFGQRFPLEALHPDHQDYGCLLLNPKNLPRNGKNQHKRNTMRQNKPYSKRATTTTTKKIARSSTKPIKKQQGKMSVTSLLNFQLDNDDDVILSSEEELDDDEDMMDDNGSSSSCLSSMINSPIEATTTSHYSPSFRVIQTYPDCLNKVPLLPPIYPSLPSPSPVTATATPTPTPSPSPSPNYVSQDIIDTISATILLQRLSQDDGARPFKPLESSVIPSKVIVGHQEFTICWD